MAKLVWASSAGSAGKQAPSAEKIALGWADNEYPPNEWFNWHQNRTDTRLNDLEDKYVRMNELVDTHSASRATYTANSVYTVPAYEVGAGTLQVYLDGIRCNPGESYAEVGASGNTSTQIKWLQDVDKTYDILCCAPIMPESDE